MIKPPWRFNRNLLVRSFSFPDKPEIEHSDLAVALKTVRRKLAFVGICERMDESLAELGRVFGKSFVGIDLQRFTCNVASHKPKLPPEWRELAEKENELDLIFYHEVASMLGAWPALPESLAANGPTLLDLPRTDLEKGNPGQVRFNIDHVLVGPGGVFIVETKARRKPVNEDGKEEYRVTFDGKLLHWPWGSDRFGIDQAKDNARTLSTWLSSAVGEGVWVTPILAFPGWMVERTVLSNDIHVLNPKQIKNTWASLPQILTASKIIQICHQLNQKCRISLED